MSRILGVGTDLIELERLDLSLRRHGQRMIDRICRAGEVNTARQGKALVQHIGGLFAAKEAVLKALGTGWGQGLGFRQVEIVGGESGPPRVQLHDRAADRAAALGIQVIHVSITHERHYASAVAIAEGDRGV
jgi:holo-[acyl-carrier protein] synthase